MGCQSDETWGGVLGLLSRSPGGTPLDVISLVEPCIFKA
jgi:hypothetical protein